MSSLLKALDSFFRALLELLTLIREGRLRKDGERAVRLEALEKAREQQRVAYEIDDRVYHGELTDADIERLRKYERDEP